VSLAVTGALLGLLGWITLQPYRRQTASRPATLGLEARTAELVTPPVYRRILVPVDHSPLDKLALSHAAALASKNHGRIFLLHVEEGVNSQLYGQESSTAEVEAGRAYLDSLIHSLSEMDIDVEACIRHGSNPKREIVRYAMEIHPDLLVMGAHGHGGLKDLVFGNTINPVRHALNVPILVVRDI
jgi:manganese transport protein